MTLISRLSPVLHALAQRDVAAVAGNHLLSKAEQATAAPDIQAAAQALRDEGAKRVTTTAFTDKMVAQSMTLISTINQGGGPGKAQLSRAEVGAAVATQSPLATRIQQAHLFASDPAIVDAAAFAQLPMIDATSTFKAFATEAEAERATDPQGRSLVWLVKTADNANTASYVWGRNDLWAQRFDISKTDNTVTITGEH
jgi:hypothetical protein